MKTILQPVNKQRKKQILLIAEILLLFIAIFIALVFGNQLIRNATEPTRFNISNVCKINLTFKNGTYNDSLRREMFQYLKSNQNVAASGYMMSSMIFQNAAFMRPCNNIKIDGTVIPAEKIELIGFDDETYKVFDLKIEEGRWFHDKDNASAFRPVVINSLFKEEVFSKHNALGKKIDYNGNLCVIVGVCSNFKHKGKYSKNKFAMISRDTRKESICYPVGHCMSGSNCGSANYIKLMDCTPAARMKLSSILAAKYPECYVQFEPLEINSKMYNFSTWLPLILCFTIIIFLFLIVLFGLFGILWYNISLRKAEIGLRMAVGASKTDIYLHFLKETLITVSYGIIPGIIICFQFLLLHTFELDIQLFIISVTEVTIFMYTLIAICTIIPCYKAGKTQPAIALHEQ